MSHERTHVSRTDTRALAGPPIYIYAQRQALACLARLGKSGSGAEPSLSLKIPQLKSYQVPHENRTWMESSFPAEGIDRQVHLRCAHLYLLGRNLAPALHLAPTLIE